MLLLNGCQCVVIPSRSESFGIVALEALAAGKPILATRVGGLVELLTELHRQCEEGGRTSSSGVPCSSDTITLDQFAMLVEPNAKALAKGLNKILNSIPQWDCSFKPPIDHYSWERVVNEYEAVMMH